MILIFSDYNDPSTNDVINWLSFFQKDYFRINTKDYFNLLSFSLSNEKGINWSIEINGKIIDYNNISFVWYRRGKLSLKDSKLNLILHPEVKQYLQKEIEVIEENIIYSLIKKQIIGNFTGTINKLNVLLIAQSIGLKIPSSSIVSSKERVQELEQEYSLISKPIFEIIPFRDLANKHIISAYTNNLQSSDIDDSFFYSLVQNKIEKDFEIRSFFVNNTFYSSAILSQVNTKTKLDFRNYDDQQPNRVVPFILPKKIENLLINLMEKLNLNSGSFDLIYSNGEYVFLEVNPVGQFGMVSHPCNYYLEKIIAQKLML